MKKHIITFVAVTFICCSVFASTTMQKVEENYKNSVFVVEVYANHPNYMWEGTGFVIKSLDNKDGTHTYDILSNAHVVDNRNVEEITWHIKSHNNALSVDVEFIGADHVVDLGLMRVTIPDKTIKEALGVSFLSAIPWGDVNQVRDQDMVLSIGNTKGRGIVSHTGHVNSVCKGQHGYTFCVMQTDAATNKGNSGSPIMNERGELIGVHFLGDRGTGVLVGYEIPADRVKKAYENIIEHQKDKGSYYGDWGLFVRPMDLILQQYHFRDQSFNGVQITQVAKGGPADRAGIRKGDLLLVEDRIYNDESLYLVNEKIADSKVGEKIDVKIFREGKIIPVSFVAKEFFAGPMAAYHTAKNFTAVDLTPDYKFIHTVETEGVFAYFDDQKQESMFGNFKKHCIIMAVDGVPTPNVQTFKKEWEKAFQSKRNVIVLKIYHSSNYYYLQDGGVGNVQYVVVRK